MLKGGDWEGTVSYQFELCEGGVRWAFTNVYCKGSREEKEYLWAELLSYKMKWGGEVDGWGQF